MNFAHLLILVVMINAASGVDEWTRPKTPLPQLLLLFSENESFTFAKRSRMAYIKVINTFLQQYYSACRESCYNKNSFYEEAPTIICENFRGSKRKIEKEAVQILESTRSQFPVTGTGLISDSYIIKGNQDYVTRVREAVRKYCANVASNTVISKNFKGDNILLKHWLIVYVYTFDLDFGAQNAESKFNEDCVR